MHFFLSRLSTRFFANYRVALLLFAAAPSLAAGGTITSSLAETGTVSHSFEYQIRSDPTALSYAVGELPPGLSLNPSTGVISGTLNASGTFAVTLTTQTISGDATGTLRLTVRPPEISDLFAKSVTVGEFYSSYIGLNVVPTGYGAAGLPPGLKLDVSTGRISGVAELSGNYSVTVTAQTAYGDATPFKFNILVAPHPTPAIPVTTLPGFPADPTVMVADPRRPRVYIWTDAALLVVDTESLEVVKTITMPREVIDLSLSANGNKLWVAYDYSWWSGEFSSYIGSIDLETLTVLPDVAFDFKPIQVREGLGGCLYVLDGGHSVRQVDSATGVSQPPFATGVWDCDIELSPDRRSLYLADDYVSAPGGGSHLSHFDVSGAAPVLVQKINTRGQDIRALEVSHNGEYLSVVTSSGGLSLLAASDLTKVFGNVPSATYGPVAFSADDKQLYQINDAAAKISVFDPANGQLLRTIDLESGAYHSGMVVDATDSYLFFAGQRVFPGRTVIEVYDIGAPPRSSPPQTLLNVSTRMRTQGGNDALIGGFIITGTEAKRIALRAIGPTLPMNGKLADPVLELYDADGVLIARNDNWNAQRAAVLATRIPPSDEHEAALAVTLQPGSYTMAVRGVNDASGIAVVEAYDLSAASESKLANISTRGKVEAGDNVMIGGFIIGGHDEETALAVRAIGPSLTKLGVAGALADPTLAIHNGNGALLAHDDDWRMYQEQQLIASGLAPTDDRESAMLLSLQPGAYTAIVRGKDNATGVGLVEIYNLDAN